MKKSTYAVLAGLTLAVSGTAFGASEQSITFNLSGYLLGNPDPTANTFTMIAGAGTVKSVAWSLTYQAGAAVGSSSWASELAIQLIAPGFAQNPYTATGFGTAPGGYHPGIGAAGTFVWGSPNTWSPGFAPGSPGSFNLGWPDSTTGTHVSAGSTVALSGLASAGTWTLRLSDAYNDGFLNGIFPTGAVATVTIYYTPAPGAVALLGLAGLAGRRRRA